MNEFLKFIVDNWVSLSSTIGMIVLWFSKRKYDKIELKKETSTALEGIQNAYDRYVNNTNAKVDELQKEINDLKQREKDWLIEKDNLQKQINGLIQQSTKDQSIIQSLKAKIANYETKTKENENKIKLLETEVNLYKNNKNVNI